MTYLWRNIIFNSQRTDAIYSISFKVSNSDDSLRAACMSLRKRITGILAYREI